MKRRQPNSNQKRIQRIYEVALAGITTALVFLLLAISMIVKYGSIGFFFFAALALVLPLYKKYYFATIFAYIAASLLCLAMPYDIMSAMGFIFYFGPISITSIIMYEKKVKWIYCFWRIEEVGWRWEREKGQIGEKGGDLTMESRRKCPFGKESVHQSY